MFTGPVGPVEVFFYCPEAVSGNFYWPGAIGSPLASSPGMAIIMHKFLILYLNPICKCLEEDSAVITMEG